MEQDLQTAFILLKKQNRVLVEENVLLKQTKIKKQKEEQFFEEQKIEIPPIRSFIDMTSNLAERQIRKYVTYRKKLLFTWSKWGNEYVERMLSVHLTCRLRQTNSFLQLSQCIA